MKADDAPKSNVYSRHIFLLPFQWRPMQSDSGDWRSRLKVMLNAVRASGEWKSGVYNHGIDFSAYNYLHDFAHGAVFEQEQPAFSSVFNFQLLKQLIFTFRVDEGAVPDSVRQLNRLPDDAPGMGVLFQLDFFMARLNVYETGVGVLSLFLDNRIHTTPAEVLLINDLARRLYPLHLNFHSGILGPIREGVLPASLRLGDWEETWAAYPHDNNKNDTPKRYLPKYILGLLGTKFGVDQEKLPPDGIVIQPVLDDRMFLMSLIVDEELGQTLGGGSVEPTPCLESSLWYSYVFADGREPQIANRDMMYDLLKQATYTRWSGKSTLYGASRYSFVAIGLPWLKTPMTNNYFRLVELCLVQRASALRFREEASEIAAHIAQNTDKRQLADKIRVLYGDYIRFINRFYFGEATPVEQGIELYDLLQRQLRVKDQVESLKSELEEMHSYAAMLHEENRNQALNFLTVLGAAFLLPSFLLAYFSLSDDWKRPLSDYPLITGGVLLAGGVMAGFLFYTRLLQQNGWKLLLGLAMILLYLCLLCLLPHLGEWR